MMLIRSRSGSAGTLIVRLWACCVVAASVGLLACGGRAADGLDGSESGLPGVSDPEGGERGPWGPKRETCEDNPLLAECPNVGGRPDAPWPPVSRDPPEEDPGEEESLQVAMARNILISQCGGCHGSPLTAEQASAAINYIDDWERLRDSDLIEQCSPRRSRIVEVMRSGEMPPPESGLAVVSEVEIRVVEEAIAFGCTE